MDRFLTIPSNSINSPKSKMLHFSKNQNNRYNDSIIKNNKYNLSNSVKKIRERNLSPLIINKKNTEKFYDELETKKYQQNFLNSLLADDGSKKIISFDQYNSVLSESLNHYKSKGLTDEEISELNTNNNFKNNKDINQSSPKKNEKELSPNKFRININSFDYKSPFQSLDIINDNNSVFNKISKEVLLRQRNLFDKSIEVLQKNINKFKVKMPKIKVSNLNTKINGEISMINLVDNKEENKNTNIFPSIPSTTGDLKLFSYFRYPRKNFPEGRAVFSLCVKENNIIISGGLASNMKTMQLWSLNIHNLQWSKIKLLNSTNYRYGHTSTYYQNKIYFFGGIIKENNKDVLAGLEIFNFSNNSFTIPQDIIDPKLRRYHIACMIGEQILFHGGIDSENEILDDCLLLNLNPLKWMNPVINKYLPMPKVYGHASCLVIPTKVLIYNNVNIYKCPDEDIPGKKSKNRIKQRGLYIFGGKTKDSEGLTNDLWVLILGQKPLYWNKIKTNGTPPCPRYFHTMDFYEKSNFLIIHGGRNDNISNSSALDDTFVLDLSNFEWVKIELYSNIPNFKVFSRYGHKSKIFSNILLILGGINNINYIGSSLFIVNLDFYYDHNIKTEEQLIMENLKNNKDDPQYEEKYIKMKKNAKNPLKEIGIVSPIVLPPIK